MSYSKYSSQYLFILGIFHPFLAFCIAIINIWNRKTHKVILLFAFFFGYTVFFHKGDILTYEKNFRSTITEYKWKDYFTILASTFFFEKDHNYSQNAFNKGADKFALSLGFLISRFTDNPRWFFAFVSLFFTYFFLQFLSEISFVVYKQNSTSWKILLAFILLLLPFYVGVTGVRFWTALYLFLWFTLKHVRLGHSKYILFASLSILIHDSFIFATFLLLVYKLLLHSSKFLNIILIFSSILIYFSTSTTGFIEIFDQLSSSWFNRDLSAYTDETQLTIKHDAIAATNWYVRWRSLLLGNSFLLFFLLDFFGVFKWETDEYLNKLQPLIIVFFCYTLITNNLGSVNRFSYAFYFLCLVRWLYIAGLPSSTQNKSIKALAFLFLPILVLHAIVSFRAGFYFVDPLLIIGNPLVFFITHLDISLSELIVGH